MTNDEVYNGLMHLSNWVDCIRSRTRPNATAEAGVGAASAAHMANRALRTGKVEHRTA